MYLSVLLLWCTLTAIQELSDEGVVCVLYLVPRDESNASDEESTTRDEEDGVDGDGDDD